MLWNDQSLAYGELDTRANQLAHHLQGLGVGPEVLVGVCLERSPDLVIALLGILKAGGAYVPLDPAYPRERLAFMLEDARVSVVVTHQHLVRALPARGPHTVCLDTDAATLEGASTTHPVSPVRPDNLAYVIYTSGSTGAAQGGVGPPSRHRQSLPLDVRALPLCPGGGVQSENFRELRRLGLGDLRALGPGRPPRHHPGRRPPGPRAAGGHTGGAPGHPARPGALVTAHDSGERRRARPPPARSGVVDLQWRGALGRPGPDVSAALAAASTPQPLRRVRSLGRLHLL